MHILLRIISLVALAITILPSIFYFTGAMQHAGVNLLAIIGTVAWFITTPFWIGRAPAESHHEIVP